MYVVEESGVTDEGFAILDLPADVFCEPFINSM